MLLLFLWFEFRQPHVAMWSFPTIPRPPRSVRIWLLTILRVTIPGTYLLTLITNSSHFALERPTNGAVWSLCMSAPDEHVEEDDAQAEDGAEVVDSRHFSCWARKRKGFEK